MRNDDLQNEIEKLKNGLEELNGKIENLQFSIVALNYCFTKLENEKRAETVEKLNKYHILTDWEE